MKTLLSGTASEVWIAEEHPTVLIGERINLAGKKRLCEALLNGDMAPIIREAVSQVAAGADALDVNVSVAGADEVVLLTKVVETLQPSVRVPLCLDSANPAALEAALRVCHGKPLINSVTGAEDSLAVVLPLVNEFGAAVIGLLQDEKGLPHDVERRLSIARKIVERAEKAGIPREDVVIDCITFAVGTDIKSPGITLETIRRVKLELGVNVVLGASNVSFGMPVRDVLNAAFVAMAIAAGATCLIANVEHVKPAVTAADLLMGKDNYGRRYVGEYRRRQAASRGDETV